MVVSIIKIIFNYLVKLNNLGKRILFGDYLMERLNTPCTESLFDFNRSAIMDGEFSNINSENITPDLLDIKTFNSVNTCIHLAGFFAVVDYKKAYDFIMHIWRVCENFNIIGWYSLHIVNNAYSHMIRNLAEVGEIEKAIYCYSQMTSSYAWEKEGINKAIKKSEKEITHSTLNLFKLHKKMMEGRGNRKKKKFIKFYLENINLHPYHTKFSIESIKNYLNERSIKNDEKNTKG